MGYIIKNETPSRVVKYSNKGEELYHELIREESQEAFLRGKEEGEKIGYGRRKEEEKAYLNLLQTITDKFLEQKTHLLNHLKPEMIDLAIAIAERVIRIELTQREKLVKLIDSLLAIASPSLQGDVVKILLSPEDLVMIESSLHEISYDKKEIKGIRFQADPLIKRGDCKIETKNALLNFNIARELDDMRAKILRF